MASQEPYFLKHSITRSPVVSNIYSQFKVNLDKKPINSTSIDHEKLLSSKHWNEISQNASSQSYDFDDDDFDIDALMDIAGPKLLEDAEAGEAPAANRTITIDILMRDSSISVNNLDCTFDLPYKVRSSCHLVSNRADDAAVDDTLLVNLKTGFLLLIKFFQIDNKLKPMIIQDINLRNYYVDKDSPFYIPKLSTLGKNLYSQDNVVLITSQSSNIKFCLCDNNKITNSVNFYVDGLIMMNCFIRLSTNHLMFLTLLFTHQRKLQFRLFEKWDDENLHQMSQYSPILLPLDFKIPLFLTSVNNLVVLVYENFIRVLGLNYFISYNLTDCKDYPISGIVSSFHVPDQKIVQDHEILVATWDGSIFSIGVEDLNNVNIQFVYKIVSPGSVTTFSISPSQNSGFKLIYATDSCGSQIIQLDSYLLRLPETVKLPSWAPVIDFSVVDGAKGDQELWLLANQQKKTSLYHLHRGYRLTTSIVDSFFKNAELVFKVEHFQMVYFVFNFLNYSSFYRFDGSQLQLIPNDELQLELKLRTIHFAQLSGPTFLHVSPNSLTIFDIDSEKQEVFINLRFNDTVVLCHSKGTHICLIFRHESFFILESLNFNTTDSTLTSNFKIPLGQLQPSMLKLFTQKDMDYLGLGFFNSETIIYELETQKLVRIPLKNMHSDFTIPHDLVVLSDTLIISSRNGYYCILDNGSSGTGAKFVKVSDFSIKLVQINESECLICSKDIYKLSLKASRFPVKCYFNYGGKVCDLVFLHSTQEIVSLTKNGLNMSSIGEDKNSIVIDKKIKLNTNCKKLFDLKALKLFLVLTGSYFENNMTNLEEPLIVINRVTKRKLNVVDLDKVIEKNEVLTTLDEWKFEYVKERSNETKCHLQLLMSCYNLETRRSSIKVVEISKSGNEDVVFNRLFQWTCHHLGKEVEGAFDNKVNFIKQLDNDEIVYALDHELFEIRYNYQLKKFEKPSIVMSFKSKINNLSVYKDWVVVTILNDSFSILRYEDTTKTFEFEVKDSTLSNLYNHLMLDDKLVLVDKYQNVLRVFKFDDFSKASIHYKTDSLLKLLRCDFAAKWDDEYRDEHEEEGRAEARGVKRRTRFITCSLSGDISMFTSLDESEFDKFNKLMHHKKLRKLFDLNYLDDWFMNNGVKSRVIESERLDELEVDGDFYDEEVDMILNGTVI